MPYSISILLPEQMNLLVAARVEATKGTRCAITEADVQQFCCGLIWQYIVAYDPTVAKEFEFLNRKVDAQ